MATTSLSRGTTVETEMSIFAVDHRWRVVDVPIVYRDRPEGSESKLSTFGDGAKVVPDAPAQVIVLPDGKCGEQGVAGIVAARIMEKLAPRQVPVCVIVGSHGSARAPEGYNVRDALAAAAPECLERFGGHALAAGLSVREGAVDRFRERFAEACRAQRGTDADEPAPERVDAWLEPADLTLELCGWIDRMRPFGEGNPEPVFGLRGMTLRDVRPLGADGRHLSLAAGGLRAVWWGHGGDVEALRASAARPCDITFHASVSDYGETHVELRVVSVSST